jgi:hypothetical protein
VYAIITYSLQGLQDPVTTKKADRLAVNAAACFVWPALILILLKATQQELGLVGNFTFLIVLLYLCQEVRAVVPYVGPLKEYQGGDTLLERSTQISTAAFAAGTILLSTSKHLSARVSPFVFLALLLAVVSTVPSGSYRKGGMDRRATWESAQKAAIAMGAGMLALAIGICVDAHLFEPAALAP